MSIMYKGQQVAGVPDVDTTLNTTSMNPIANSPVAIEFNNVRSALTGIGTVGGVVLTSSNNLNDVLLPGFYSWVYSSKPTNYPVNTTSSMIVSQASNSRVQQIVLADFQIFYRYLSGGSWSAWEELVTKSAITPQSVNVTASASVDDNGLSAYKVGNIVYISGYFHVGSAIAKNTVFLTLGSAVAFASYAYVHIFNAADGSVYTGAIAQGSSSISVSERTLPVGWYNMTASFLIQ